MTVYPFNDKLYAFDEVSPPLDARSATLKTDGAQALGDPAREFMIKAHTKFDPADRRMAAVRHQPRPYDANCMRSSMVRTAASNRIRSSLPAPDLHPRFSGDRETFHLRAAADDVLAMAVPRPAVRASSNG